MFLISSLYDPPCAEHGCVMEGAFVECSRAMCWVLVLFSVGVTREASSIVASMKKASGKD